MTGRTETLIVLATAYFIIVAATFIAVGMVLMVLDVVGVVA